MLEHISKKNFVIKFFFNFFFAKTTGAVGGQFGLFMGASLVTCVELVVLVLLFGRAIFSKMARGGQKRN